MHTGSTSRPSSKALDTKALDKCFIFYALRYASGIICCSDRKLRLRSVYQKCFGQLPFKFSASISCQACVCAATTWVCAELW